MSRELKPPDADKTAATESAIDWSIPIEDTAFHFDPHHLNLYGTPAWEAMTQAQRWTYSRHEAAAGYCGGTWIENILVHCLMAHLYAMPASNPLHLFLYLEAAEECRHSAMFCEFIRRAKTPPYVPSRRIRFMGKLLQWTGTRAIQYLSILAGEELAEGYTRATARAVGIHPVSKRMSELHVIDEASHMSFAREHIARLWAEQNWIRRWYARWYMPTVVYTLVDASVNPEVYKTLKIAGGYRMAWRNPHRRRQIIEDLRPYTDFLRKLGVINDFYLPIWRALGLIV